MAGGVRWSPAGMKVSRARRHLILLPHPDLSGMG